MSALRLYSPVLVFLIWIVLALAGVTCMVGMSLVLLAALLVHGRELRELHVLRFRRRYR